jgi:hypothetical protein
MIKGCTPNKIVTSKPLMILFSMTLLQSSLYAAEQVAVVIASVGKATANARALTRKAALYQGDTITTDAGGKVSFKFTDGSVVTLAEKSSYTIKNYSFKAGSKPDTFDAHLIKGGLKTTTGTIGKEAQHTQDAIDAGIPINQQVKVSHYKVQAAIATIGVRGTDYKCAIAESTRTNSDVVQVSVSEGTVEASFEGNDLLIGDGADASYVEIDTSGNSTSFSHDQIKDNFDIDDDEDEDSDDDGDGDSDDGDDDGDDGDDGGSDGDAGGYEGSE